MYFDPNMRSNSKFALITAALLLMLASPVARAEIRFYVAPSGSDAQNGTSPAQPFLTVQRAQQAVRELKQRGPLTEPVTVYLSEGVYPRNAEIYAGRFGYRNLSDHLQSRTR